MSDRSIINPWLKADGLRVGHLNINHCINKTTEISSILTNSGKNFHIFGFSESRLSTAISDSDISFPGYNIIRRDPIQSRETGLLLYIHQSIRFLRIMSLEQQNVETVWVEIQVKYYKPFLICFLYRNPAERIDWIDRFNSMMDHAYDQSKDIIILGDFNIDLLKDNNQWTRTFQSFGLTQLIQSPTRITNISETLIDHLYVTDKKKLLLKQMFLYLVVAIIFLFVSRGRKKVLRFLNYTTKQLHLEISPNSIVKNFSSTFYFHL